MPKREREALISMAQFHQAAVRLLHTLESQRQQQRYDVSAGSAALSVD